MKICTKCGEAKPLIAYSKHFISRDGLQSHCKACAKIASAAYYVANREKLNASSAAYGSAWYAANKNKVMAGLTARRKNNPEAYRLYNQNRRARANGGKLSHDIAERLFKLQRGKCACGCKQPLGDDFHRDHIMPIALDGSNTDDNIQLLRAICNMQKSAKHPVDFMQQRGFLL